eukprot:16220633-Heterocapsa_arctica.AAC.1
MFGSRRRRVCSIARRVCFDTSDFSAPLQPPPPPPPTSTHRVAPVEELILPDENMEEVVDAAASENEGGSRDLPAPPVPHNPLTEDDAPATHTFEDSQSTSPESLATGPDLA